MDLNIWKERVKRAEKIQGLKPFSYSERQDLICMLLEEDELIWCDTVKIFLNRKRLFLTLATFLVEKDSLYSWPSSSLFEAVEAYEKAGKLEKALSLCQRGVKLFNPYNMTTYDEGTGGEVSITDYPESNQKRIEEAFLHQEQCEKKAKEMKKKIAERDEHIKQMQEKNNILKDPK